MGVDGQKQINTPEKCNPWHALSFCVSVRNSVPRKSKKNRKIFGTSVNIDGTDSNREYAGSVGVLTEQQDSSGKA